MKVPSSPLEPVVGVVDAVAQDEAVLGQLVGDRQHGGADPRVVGRQEPHERHQQDRRVERRRVVVLGEHAALVERVVADVGVDLVGDAAPAHRLLPVLPQLGQARAAVQRHPAHELGRGEVLLLAAHLPDAAVRPAPVRHRRLDLLDEDRPHALGQVVAGLGVEVHRVEHRAPDVVLVLVVRAVADPHRAGVLVARQVIERRLRQLGAAVDAVHDLQLSLDRLGDVGDEVEEVVGLPVEAERVEAPERERRVADPRVAVVPVALAAGRLGQRRGGGGDDRAGRRVREALERERAALEVGAPRVVGELAAVEPVLPVMGGPDQAVVGLVVACAAPRARSTRARRTPSRPPSSCAARSSAGLRCRG